MKKINKFLVLGFCFMLLPNNVNAQIKNETVFSKMNYYGVNNNNTIVNNHLFVKNKDEINDNSDLLNILNINGEEKYYVTDGKLTWENNGKDIFYQGITNKDLPITTQITYYLDGKESKIDDILGKSGDVSIEILFTNNVSETVLVNGSYETLYTPFVVSVGTILNNKNNSGITITNGKVVDTGSRSILVGLASPGLYESTNIDSFKDLNKITISYKTDKFSLNDIYLVATPKLLEQDDLKIFDKLDGILYKANDLNSGINSISSGVKNIKNGSTEIANNLNYILGQMKDLEDGASRINQGINDIISSINSVDTSMDTSKIDVLKSKNNLVIDKLTGANKTILTIYNGIPISKEYALDKLSDELINTMISNGLIDLESANGIKTLRDNYINNTNMIELISMNNLAMDGFITEASNTSAKINGIVTELGKGLSGLSKGSNDLKEGILSLESGINLLYEGSSDLSNGLDELDKGVDEFKIKGIDTISNYAYIISNYSERIKKLAYLSHEYNGFACSNANSTVLIYLVEGVK